MPFPDDYDDMADFLDELDDNYNPNEYIDEEPPEEPITVSNGTQPIENNTVSDGTVQTITNQTIDSYILQTRPGYQMYSPRLYEYHDNGLFRSPDNEINHTYQGVVHELRLGYIIYLGGEFAPGFWAGREETSVFIGNSEHKIKEIKLDTREIVLYPTNKIHEGDNIYA